ncbi:glutamate receptor ionotropic, kainate glr-3-like [Tachypleus tridentatus]|uniref:glutamate receptor ionotropic, kainate glr-3-like n=1 Tax=Tachypleus tridentatus TaxID=6853 RepID=UPI003FD532E6
MSVSFQTRNSTFLHVAVDEWFPFVKVTRDGHNEISINGPMKFVLQDLTRSLNFSYTLMSPDDHQWGVQLSNGKWTGMIGMVHRGEVDFALGPFAINYERHQVTDMTNPLYVTHLAVLSGVPRQAPNFFRYLLVCDLKVCLGVLLALLFLTIISASFVLIQEDRTTNNGWVFLSLTNCWSFWRILLYQGSNNLSKYFLLDL